MLSFLCVSQLSPESSDLLSPQSLLFQLSQENGHEKRERLINYFFQLGLLVKSTLEQEEAKKFPAAHVIVIAWPSLVEGLRS